MADTDPALYVLRYNQTSQKLEASGGTPEWNSLTLTNPGSVAAPAGDDAQVQFNDSGSFGAVAGFEYDKNTSYLTINNVQPISGGNFIIQCQDDNHAFVQISPNATTVVSSSGLINLANADTIVDKNVYIGNANGVQTLAVNVDYSMIDSSACAQFDAGADHNRGFLSPRLTTTQRDAITSPAEGLEIYNTTTHTKNYWDGSVWQEVATV